MEISWHFLGLGFSSCTLLMTFPQSTFFHFSLHPPCYPLLGARNSATSYPHLPSPSLYFLFILLFDGYVLCLDIQWISSTLDIGGDGSSFRTCVLSNGGIC